MQKAYITALYELMRKDKNVLSLLSDSGTEYDELLMREFPEQCYNFGIAEQHLVGAAGGMANCGKIPFVYTTGAFLAYRAMEFIRDDICFQNNNVKIIGMGSGLAWATLGASHHTTEDIAILRSIPNLTVISAASPLEIKEAVRVAYEIEGPVYIRTGMSNEEEIYNEDYKMILGKPEGITDETDTVVLSTGSIISEVLEARRILQDKGISIQVVNVHTLKPIDTDSYLKLFTNKKLIFTVEEHNVLGGLGTIISDLLVDNQLYIPVKKIGLPDTFAKGYGTQQEVRKQNGLDSRTISAIIEKGIQLSGE